MTKFVEYKKARQYAKKNKIKTKRQWAKDHGIKSSIEWYQTKLPKNIPRTPQNIYA